MRSKPNEAENSNESLYISVPIIVFGGLFFTAFQTKFGSSHVREELPELKAGIACIRWVHETNVHMDIVCIVVQEHDRHQVV